MPIVSEIQSGSSNERSCEGGSLADTSVRTWRIVLSSPSEAYNISQEIGVRIGDAHPLNTNVPCVSIAERADGDSRLVRLVTATYRTTPGGSGQNDPNQDSPDVRPARFTISSTLIEVPAQKWAELTFTGDAAQLGADEDPLNPAKDRYDNASMLTPVINISLEQYDSSPTSRLDIVGSVNSDDFSFLGLRIFPYHCMLRGITVRPTVESHGGGIYRGFVRSYEFMVYPPAASVVGGVSPSRFGFWVDQILEGFNIINANQLNNPEVFADGLVLEHKDGKVLEPPAGAKAIAAGTAGKKMRAVVPIYFPGGGWCQRPSAQPVALNLDGTPRNVNRAGAPAGWEPVLRKKYVTAKDTKFGDNFVKLGVRVAEIL